MTDLTSKNITYQLKKTLIIVLLMYVCCIFTVMTSDEELFAFVNRTFPLVLFFLCLYTAYVILKIEKLSIWTPLPWFMAVCGVYYGFGPLVYIYGNPESIQYVDYTYSMDPLSLTRTIQLNCIAISCVVTGYIVGTKLPPFPPRISNFCFNEIFVRRLLLFFLSVGLPVKYLVILPAHFGLIDFVVPGSVIFFASLSSLSIILLFALMHWTGDKKYKIMLLILITVELLSSLMMLAKIAVITTAIMILLGRYICKPNIKQFAAGASVIIVIFIFFLTPFVNYARYVYNVKGISSISEFGSSIDMYTEKQENKLLYSMPGVQAWWLRLNYANVQAFSMDAYDNGTPGKSLNLVFVALIPRFLFPDKPSLQLGAEFHKLLTGFDNSQSSPGLFAEAYWNGGWIVVVVSSLILGFVYSIYSKFSIALLSAHKFGYLPVIFSGIIMGLRPDDWYVSTVLVLSFQAMLLYVAFRKIFKVFGDE